MTTGTYPGFPPARRDPRQVTNTLRRTLNFNDSDAALASFFSSLPQGAFILGVMVEVVTAFNAGTTNPLTVGGNATSYNNLVASGDVDLTTVGVTEVKRGLGRSVASAADTPVLATYVPTGTAATTGQAVIVIEFEGGWAS